MPTDGFQSKMSSRTRVRETGMLTGRFSLQVGENRSATGALLELETVVNAGDGGGVFDVPTRRFTERRAEFRRPFETRINPRHDTWRHRTGGCFPGSNQCIVYTIRYTIKPLVKLSVYYRPRALSNFPCMSTTVHRGSDPCNGHIKGVSVSDTGVQSSCVQLNGGSLI
ncbi:hypothetical protein EYF80_041718 [Liparis tanakae]|uniref:Uncharacterized protein n=1 Tax=Liparis tanakae TaxID=230148 RepID=A0A4Z2G5D9_9TELE|nr:hypothetical protein EYF80_041718 [Liparis tanakae]